MWLKVFLVKSVVDFALVSRVAEFSTWKTMITGILERES